MTSLSDQAGTVSYTYDANGNVLTVSDSAGTISRKYDALNRVTEYTDTKGNTIRYDYDAVGNLTALTYPGGKQVRYDYDAANRLTRVTDWAGRVTSYEYDANGRLTRTSRPNGTAETRSYDAAGQLTHQSDLDAAGNVIIQYDYTYDAAGNVTAEESAVPKLPFTLDNAAMTFTSGNRLASFNGQPVSYDADGNMTTGPLAGQIANYVYDARNRLISAGSLSYQYDAENNRISVTDSVYNTQTGYVINPNAPLSQVLIQTDAQGNQTYYVYGLGLIGQDINGAFITYHFDLRGSTVALTDMGENVTDRFQYAPYGEMVKHTGTTFTPFLYTGRHGVMADINGLYYMRARYFNTELKRFVNQDILLGSIVKGQSLNRYAYVNGQPVSYIDPTGYDASLERIFDTKSIQDPTITILVLQPVPGTRTAIGPEGVGHTFIRLDSGMDSNGNRTILYSGFYPRGGDLQRKDILRNLDNYDVEAEIDDDSQHAWNIGKIYSIDLDSFNRVKDYTDNHDLHYNLLSKNCTTFAIGALEAAGIQSPTTRHFWDLPAKYEWEALALGYHLWDVGGYDPADAGEDIRGLGGFITPDCEGSN